MDLPHVPMGRLVDGATTSTLRERVTIIITAKSHQHNKPKFLFSYALSPGQQRKKNPMKRKNRRRTTIATFKHLWQHIWSRFLNHCPYDPNQISPDGMLLVLPAAAAGLVGLARPHLAKKHGHIVHWLLLPRGNHGRCPGEDVRACVSGSTRVGVTRNVLFWLQLDAGCFILLWI